MDDRTISLPERILDMIESRVESGSYSSASDYLAQLVERDQLHASMSMEDLRALLQKSRDSGISSRTLDEIRSDGLRLARERGLI